ncbi:hypothetical protein QNO08_15790 [Arthrobacter sp. zg-Y820]|nr:MULTISPECIES: hypothetical protein [unclassified Arthrobacter]MCC9197100.1 hypothetical protein [Arthrobacter sp. zg-Y820]MDK1279965.1 hypothetical protein [Arthrobacter sp. zg.Y820]WIB09264.1 hypothetical protein QNO08_15790 [Arthrobacter sp. zg-Y820]
MTRITVPSTAYLNQLDAETGRRMQTASTPESPFAGAAAALAAVVEAKVV